MVKPKKTIAWIFKAVLLGLTIGGSFFGGYIARPYITPDAKKYSDAIQFVIDNPEYAEKLFATHKKYVLTAEQLMVEQLDTMAGGSATPKEKSGN